MNFRNSQLSGRLTPDGALPVQSSGAMEVADGDSKSVGGVHRLGRNGEFEQARDHVLDLLLLGTAVTDHRRLDREWRVFGDFESGCRGGQHGDSTNLAEFQGRFHIEGVENVFDGHFVRLVLGDDRTQMHVDA